MSKPSSTSTTVKTAPLGQEIRAHPRLKLMLRQAEGRVFSDDELRVLGNIFPSLQPRCHAAREFASFIPDLAAEVVEELTHCYSMEDYNEVAMEKTVRDIHFTLAYAQHAMILDDPSWFDDKLLIWMKTMLRAFDFPDLKPDAPVDKDLRIKLEALPAKARCVYHGYESLRRRAQERLADRNYQHMEPFLRQINKTLMEDYVIVEGMEL